MVSPEERSLTVIDNKKKNSLFLETIKNGTVPHS